MFRLLVIVLVLNLCIVQNFATIMYLPIRSPHTYPYNGGFVSHKPCHFTSAYGFSGVSPQPANTLPYKLKASAYNYNPGTTITVMIDGDTFRGFYIRALMKPLKNLWDLGRSQPPYMRWTNAMQPLKLIAKIKNLLSSNGILLQEGVEKFTSRL
uniref:Putative secreted protein n=1 Tax=Lutzomyia longipalpis TaxID=7200 RepID=A0A7G3AKZ4_LUTLO